ncbi:MAG: hypothetical protein V1855_04850 [bacterium]
MKKFYKKKCIGPKIFDQVKKKLTGIGSVIKPCEMRAVINAGIPGDRRQPFVHDLYLWQDIKTYFEDKGYMSLEKKAVKIKVTRFIVEKIKRFFYD